MNGALTAILQWFSDGMTKVQSRKLFSMVSGVAAILYLQNEAQMNVQTAGICIAAMVGLYLLTQAACDIAEMHSPAHAYDGEKEIPPPAKVSAPEPLKTYEPVDN